jgi:hypothetical protein
MIMIVKIINEKLLSSICFTVCSISFIVGLWPFNFIPHNKVEWLSGRNGVHFKGGIIYSPEQFILTPDPYDHAGISIELWLSPETESTYTTAQILSFSNNSSYESFFIGQWKTYIILQHKLKNYDRGFTSQKIGLCNTFHSGETHFISITYCYPQSFE